MSATSDIQTLAMKLPPKSRLKLAGELLRSLPAVADHSDLLAEAKTRDAQLENGSILPLSEEEFWQGATTTRRPG